MEATLTPAKAFLDTDSTMAFLARYGRDVAGALKIWDPTAAGEPRTQPKLVLVRENNQWGQAVDGFASTHII